VKIILNYKKMKVCQQLSMQKQLFPVPQTLPAIRKIFAALPFSRSFDGGARQKHQKTGCP
jgi:hypothetical protein